MTFSLGASLNVPKPFTVGLDPLNLSLFVRDVKPEVPYVYLQLPAQKLHGNSTFYIASQRANIVSSTQWLSFLNDSLYNEDLTLSAKGETTAHFGALKAKLKLDKNVKIKGI